MANTGNYGLSLYGLDPYGSDWAPFGVAGATSYSPHFVQVRFTDLIDLGDPQYLNPANYVITPTLAVHGVIIESADSVILQTDTQTFLTYLVTVGEATSFFGQPMVPPLNKATFNGFPSQSGYFSAATTPFRIRCIFSVPMQVNAALTNPISYTITDLNENVFTVLTAVPEQSGNPLSVVLTLATPMERDNWYQSILSPALVDINGQSPKPSAVDFQFILPATSTQVPISDFSGEVSSGILGDPDGLVFFSPSLNVAASNSIIQVEEVDVCTTAYDTYTPPQPIDPVPFYVWSPKGPQTFLDQQGVVLFAGFPRMSQAKFELEFEGPFLVEPMPQANDPSCCITVTQTYAPGYVPLLNDPAFWMFDGTHNTTPPMWITAEIGAVFAIVAVTNHGGQIEVQTSTPTKFSTGNAVNVFGVLEDFVVTASGVANSSVSAHAAVHHHATAAIVAGASIAPIKTGLTIATIMAGAHVSATATVNRRVASAISAGASVADHSPVDPNGSWNIRVIDTTHFILEGSSFVNPYLSGGSVYGPNPVPPPPPGTEQIIVLHCALGGQATMTVAQPQVVHWAMAHIEADSSFATSPELPPMNIAVNSYMRVKRPSQNMGVTAAISGGATMTIAGHPAPVADHVQAAIVGYAIVDAHCEQQWQVQAVLEASSSIFVRANRHVFAQATITAGSSISATATKGPAGQAHIVAGSSVSAQVTLHHFASASISGGSSVTATAT